MTVTELRRILEELEMEGRGEDQVKLAYQPNYPMEVKLSHVYAEFETDFEEISGIYLCQSPYGGSNYAPRAVFEDEENFLNI